MRDRSLVHTSIFTDFNGALQNLCPGSHIYITKVHNLSAVIKFLSYRRESVQWIDVFILSHRTNFDVIISSRVLPSFYWEQP